MSEIRENNYTFLSAEGKTQIHVKEWIPENVSGVVQISHGMAEHKERYGDFARFLCDAGFAVVAQDLLGHGESIQDEKHLGYFADEDGWTKLVDDMETIRKTSAEKFGDVPYFMFGHSMGSFLVRSYLIMYPEASLSGAVICGTGQNPDMIVKIGKSIAQGEINKYGAMQSSEKLDRMAFGGYNKKIDNPRTKFDWLSVDTENVDKYIADPLCGFVATAGFFRDMMGGLQIIGKSSGLKKMNTDVPVLFTSGGSDPVGDFSKAVVKVASNFRKAGMKDISVKIYDGYRHEILNESEIKETVMDDMLEWFKAKSV